VDWPSMRIIYQSGKLYISLTKDEYKDIEPGTPTEIDIGNISVLLKDITNISYERLKELECTKK
jgi:hypothetical protein